MYDYVASYFSFQGPAEEKHINKVKDKEGVTVIREFGDTWSSNKRYTIMFTHSDPTLRSCDFRLPNSWNVTRTTKVSRSEMNRFAAKKGMK